MKIVRVKAKLITQTQRVIPSLLLPPNTGYAILKTLPSTLRRVAQSLCGPRNGLSESRSGVANGRSESAYCAA
jgi:hypothetical protein